MEKDYKTVWANCLSIIKDNLGKENEQVYHTWFEPIVPVQLEENVLTIQVPSQFFYEWLEQHFIDLLKQTIRLELGPAGMLKYSIVMDQSISGSPKHAKSKSIKTGFSPSKKLWCTTSPCNNANSLFFFVFIFCNACSAKLAIV